MRLKPIHMPIRMGKAPDSHAEPPLGIRLVGATIFPSFSVCRYEEGIWTFPIA